MSSVYRDADRRRVDREIREERYQELLERLQKRDPSLRSFAHWGEVAAFMHQGALQVPVKDVVLLTIFKAHVADRDQRWRAILLAIFWPTLESICRRKRRWDDDEDELWTNVSWGFSQAICRLNPDQRAERLAQKITNDTLHRLHDEYRRVWNHAKRQLATDPDTLSAGYAVDESRKSAATTLREEQEARIAQLQAHLDAGRIDDTDFLILVGKNVYGHSLADSAQQAGVGYEAAKKRHQRAIRAIGGLPPP